MIAAATAIKLLVILGLLAICGLGLWLGKSIDVGDKDE